MAFRKGDPGSYKGKHYVALCGEFALGEATGPSKDKLHDDDYADEDDDDVHDDT